MRSNRALIFLSCIKGTALSGGFAGEQDLLIFAVYFMVCPNVYTNPWGVTAKIHSLLICLSVLIRQITASYFFHKACQKPLVQHCATKPTGSFLPSIVCALAHWPHREASMVELQMKRNGCGIKWDQAKREQELRRQIICYQNNECCIDIDKLIKSS